MVEDEAKAIAKDAELFAKLAEWAKTCARQGRRQRRLRRAAGIALLALEAKRYDVANEFFELASKVKRDEPAELLLTWGLGLLVAEQYADAAKVFQKGIDARRWGPTTPASITIWPGRWRWPARPTKRWPWPAPPCHMAPCLGPHAWSRGWVLYHAKRYEEALASYQELIDRIRFATAVGRNSRRRCATRGWCCRTSA